MVKEDGGRGPSSEEGAIEEGRGPHANASGDVRPRVEEVEEGEAVGGGMMQVDAQAHATALEKCYLQRFRFDFKSTTDHFAASAGANLITTII